MTLPQEILERVARVQRYHALTKHAFPTPLEPPGLDLRTRPSPYRVFDDAPRAALATTLLDVPCDTLRLMAEGLDALPESTLCPPQNLKTLSTWLFMADGLTQKKDEGRRVTWTRSCPSSGASYPYEIYVAAFAIDGLEPGLYHYCPKEFNLRKLRDGREALAVMKRGRPDLEFLKTVPAALLVSTIYWRSAWRFGKRAYRYALLDAGHLVGNLTVAGTGLGIQTLTRLQMKESCMRELIGLSPDAEFGQEESVQAMVVWADKARKPLIPPRGTHADGNGHDATYDLAPPANADPGADPAGARPAFTGSAGSVAHATMDDAAPAIHMPIGVSLPPINRGPLSATFTPYASILAAHQDCVAPGVAVREVRSPLTELSPLPPNYPVAEFKPGDDLIEGHSLRSVLLNRRTPVDYQRGALRRDKFMHLVRLAFRGGSFFPMFPAGPHVALVRPCWLIHAVEGMQHGIWYYHPPTDAWSQIGRTRDYRLEAAYLSLELPICGNASAVCFMFANTQYLMAHAGPDVYRLAHLEAGIVAQRMALAGSAMNYGASAIGGFYDEEVRQFFGLANSGWEPIYEVAVGAPIDPDAPPKPVEEKVDVNDDSIWRD